MLTQRYRFHSRGGVNYVYQNSKTIRSPYLALLFAPNIRKRQRFAVVVSKKVLKHAVGRNRIRRRVYEAIRLEHSHFRRVPKDFVFIVHNKIIATMPFDELRQLVYDLLQRATFK